MCGIAGVYRKSDSADASQLHAAAQTLRHRGPDDIGTYVDGSFGMAHTRLSIIDLTGGHQPLFAADDNLVLIANGEIYNYIELRQALIKKGHRFSTHSDSEVILYAYLEFGDDFIKHLHGMFAFALYDRLRAHLILARDRLGIKPLFIAEQPGGIAFASEIKALLKLIPGAPEINPAGLAQYLQNQFSSERITPIKGIQRLLPAEAVRIEKGVIQKRWQYWSASEIETVSLSIEEAGEQFEPLMETVMQEHMRSDVPYGLFLSGGVDSSILLAMLSRYAKEPIRTFSVGFKSPDLIDELPMAEDLATRFATRHTSVRPDRDAIFQSLPYTVWAADELMRDYASLPTALLAQAAGAELKVVFSGEGGDEAFAGYGRYRSAGIERRFKQLLHPGSGGFRARGTFRGRWPVKLFGPALQTAVKVARQPFINAWQTAPRRWSDLQRMQYTDLITALPDNLLVKGDRMLMGWGVEGRVPFLDHRIVEFGLALPDKLKIFNNQGKYFLKHWASKFLPEQYLFAKKRGFHVPVRQWFTRDYCTRLKACLPRHEAIKTWFDSRGVEALITSNKIDGPVSRMIWSLLQFVVWYEIFINGNGERPPVKLEPLDLINK